jgi:hypothetical protein
MTTAMNVNPATSVTSTAKTFPKSRWKVSVLPPATHESTSTVAEDAAAYAHPINDDSAEMRLDVSTSPSPTGSEGRRQ